MRGKKLADFDKSNPNYKFLIEAINSGNVRLIEDECLALIIPPSSLHLKFGLGMKAYLNNQGYSTYIAWNPES
jgi:hypothetical protein